MSASNIYTIYKVTNLINGKSYIGFDSRWPRRSKIHKYSANNLSPCIFHRTIRKHGWNSFIWEPIYQSLERDHTRNEMEGYFIRQENTHYIDGHGYNMTYGGEGERGNKSRTGMKHTQATKDIISYKNRGKIAWNKGKVLSDKKLHYILITPTGEQEKVIGLVDLERKYNTQSFTHSLKTGKPLQMGKWKGWQLIRVSKNKKLAQTAAISLQP